MKNKFMNKKRSIILGLLTAATAASIVAVSVSKSSNNLFFGTSYAGQCLVCHGNHYERNLSIGGKGADRVAEYWVCCDCHQHYLSKDDIPGYADANFEDAGIADRSKITEASDDRLFFGGTEKTYNVNKLGSTASITVDGQRDDAYDAATKYNFASVLDGNSTATATLEAVWKDKLIYLFIDVKDPVLQIRESTAGGERWIEWDDSIQIKVDTLHSEELATGSWAGGTGGEYRAGKACEGFYKCCADITTIHPDTKNDYTRGVYMDEWSYLSNLQRSDSSTFISSVVNEMEDGYSFEVCLNTDFGDAIVNNVIGLNMMIFDYQNGVYKGAIPFEHTNWDHAYVRSYSNFLLVGRGE